MRIFICLILFLFSMQSAAAEESQLHKRALVAGFKAAFVCSATFNAGKDYAEIARDELSMVMPDYRELMAFLPMPVINKVRKTVFVSYGEGLPPRIAVWRKHLGCTQLPIGASFEVVLNVPTIELQPRHDASTVLWPRGDGVQTPEPAAALQTVLDAAFDGRTYGAGNKTTALFITTPNQVLAEQYRKGFTFETSQRTWSVAKSLAATVVGAAIYQGILDLDAPAPIPEWQSPGDPRSKITLKNLFHMSSGLNSGFAGNRTDDIYFGGGLVTDFATRGSLEALPGQRWKYANNDTMLIARALRAAIGDDQTYLKFPFLEVFHKIAMTRTVPETDWQGNFVFSSQVWTTARDLGRLGILYLQDGVWNGERLLPEGWARFVATPAPSQPPMARGDGSPIMGYGAQFWLLNARFPNVPDDAYTAAGHRGQYMVIIPSKNLVIVRRGYDPSGGARFKLDKLVEDILAALENF